MPRQLLVAGGPRSLVYGNFSRKLAEHDAQVGWHVEGLDKEGDTFQGIPAHCDGVILLCDMQGHSEFYKVRDAAKAAGVPCAAAHRKWSHALPILRMQGVLPAAPADPSGLPTEGALRDAALKYVVETHTHEKRTPSHDEVEDALKRAFGPNVYLKAPEYRVVYSRACTLAPLSVEPPAPTPSDPPISDYSWVATLVEENPDFIKDATGLAQEMQRITDRTPEIPEILRGLRDVGVKLAAQAGPDYEWKLKLQDRWLSRWFQRFLDTGTDFPTNRAVLERSKALFGTSIEWLRARQIRATVMGAWALDLAHAAEVAVYLGEKYPHVTSTLRDLLEAKKVRGVYAGRWYTSTVAVDDAFKTEPEVVIPEPEVVPVPEVTAPKAAPDTLQEDTLFLLAGMVEDKVVERVTGLLEGFVARIEARLESFERRLETAKTTPEDNRSPLNPEVLKALLGSAVTTEVRLLFNQVSPASDPKRGS